MQREPVSSSNLASVGYGNQVLEIEFRGGRVYRYFDVPERVHQELVTASSVGRYFHTNVRDVYEFERVE